MDTLETQQSPPSPSPTNFFSQQPRHFYVAVDRIQFKMETLVELLGMAGRRRPGLPVVVCCSSRDELDSVCSAVSNLPAISLSFVYSDLADNERTQVLEKFRHSAVRWNQHVDAELGEGGCEDCKSRVVVVTDACLPLLAAGESPLPARVLINYELPSKKEMYSRRLASCLAQDGILINMVVGGEVVTLKAVEESSGLVIAEMPINECKGLYSMYLCEDFDFGLRLNGKISEIL